MNVAIEVSSITLNGTEMAADTYSATTNPESFSGTGTIVVAGTVSSFKAELAQAPVSVV